MVNTVYQMFKNGKRPDSPPPPPFLIFCYTHIYISASFLLGVQIFYVRMVLATAECDFTEREAAWSGFRTG